MPQPSSHKEVDAEQGRGYDQFSETTKSAVTRFSCRSVRPLDPESRFCEVWDMLFLVVLMLVAVFSPIEVAFDLNPYSTLPANWVANTIYFIDMLLRFLTAYHEESPSSRYVKDFRKIARKYLFGWFLVDLVSTLPTQLLPMCPSAHLLRMLRLHRVPEIVRQHQTKIGFSFALLSLGKFLIVLFFTSHWIACLWASSAWNHPDGSWLEALQGSKSAPSSLYEDWFNVYIISLYWAIMTLTSIGYGDISPQNLREYVISSCCMAIMAAMWAVVIGQMCGVLATLLPHDVAFKRTMDDLNWMMKDREMPKNVRSQLRRYFWESRSLNRLQEQRAIVEQMSPMLQGVVAKQLTDQCLAKVPYLQNLESEVLVAVARKLKPMLFAPEEAIDMQRTLFVVRRGVCMHGGRVLVGGSVWGEDMLLSNPNLRDGSSVRCLSYLEVLSLRHADLMDAVRSQKSRSILRWWQIRFAFKCAMVKIGREVSRMQRHQRANFTAMPDELRQSLVCGMLQGQKVEDLFARKSSTCSITSTAASLTSIEPSSTLAVPAGRAGPNQATVLVEADELHKIRLAITSLTQTVEQLQQTVLDMSG